MPGFMGHIVILRGVLGIREELMFHSKLAVGFSAGVLF